MRGFRARAGYAETAGWTQTACVNLVRIGNSRGIRIPKPVIDQCGFGDTVDLRIETGRLVVTPDRTPRQGWESAFRAAGPPGEGQLLPDTIPPSEFDREEWQW